MTSPAAVAFLYILISLIWGSTWLAIKIGLVGVPPFLSAGLRFALAASVLFVLLGLKRRKPVLDAGGRVAVLSCGFLSFTFGYAVTYWAELFIPSGLTAILWCTMPLGVALLSRFWTRSEALGVRKISGILLGMAGTAALFWTGEAVTRAQWWGMGAALSGVVAASVNAVTVKKHARHTDVLVMNAYGMTIGAVCLLALSALTESYGGISWTPANVAAIVYLALAGTVVTFMSYYHLLKLMDASKLSTITLIFPIIALLLGRAFGGEAITRGALFAIAAVLAGVAVALFPGTKRSV